MAKRSSKRVLAVFVGIALMCVFAGGQAEKNEFPRDLLEANLRARAPLQDFWKKLTADEILNANFKAIKAFEEFWLSKSPDEILKANLKARDALADLWKRRSPDEILKANLKAREALKDLWKSKSPEEIMDASLSAMEPFWNTDLVPEFSFSELVFSADYASVEEKVVEDAQTWDDGTLFTETNYYTDYYDADGNLIRRVIVTEGIEHYPYEDFHSEGRYEANYARIGDSDYFAGIITFHFENPIIHYVNDETYYVIRHGDQQYNVDEEGNPLPEEDE